MRLDCELMVIWAGAGPLGCGGDDKLDGEDSQDSADPMREGDSGAGALPRIEVTQEAAETLCAVVSGLERAPRAFGRRGRAARRAR